MAEETVVSVGSAAAEIVTTLDEGGPPNVTVQLDVVASDKPKAVVETVTARPPTLGQALSKSTVKPTVATSVAPRIVVPKVPVGLKCGFTGELKEAAFLHAILYADTGMRKTTIACTFDDPDHTLIVATRRPEQLTPVRDLDYPYIEVADAAVLEYSLLYPEFVWDSLRARKPALGELRTLVLDDATEAVEMLLEGARDDLEEGGREVKDRRRIYFRGKDELRDIIKVTLRKPLNFVATAVAKVRENPITNEETVGPDLPPSMLGFIGAEFEFVFYIRPTDYKFTTERDRFSFVATDDQGREKTYQRNILAKNKLPLSVAKMTPPVLNKYEEADLRKVWAKVQGATKAANGTVKSTAVKATPAPPTGIKR